MKMGFELIGSENIKGVDGVMFMCALPTQIQDKQNHIFHFKKLHSDVAQWEIIKAVKQADL